MIKHFFGLTVNTNFHFNKRLILKNSCISVQQYPIIHGCAGQTQHTALFYNASNKII